MSKQSEKFSSTLYNSNAKKNKTPPKTDSNARKNQKSYDFKKKISDSQMFQ